MRAKQPPATLGAIFRAHYVSILFTLAYALGSLAYLFPDNYRYYESVTMWRSLASFTLGYAFSTVAAVGMAIDSILLAALAIFGTAFTIGLFVEFLWKTHTVSKILLFLLVIPNWFLGIFAILGNARLVPCEKQFHLGNDIVTVRLFNESGFGPYFTTFLLSSSEGERWQQDQRLSSPFQNSDTTCANFQGDEHAVVLVNEDEIYTQTTARDEWRRYMEWRGGWAARSITCTSTIPRTVLSN